MNIMPVGGVAICRFYFGTRVLSPAELAAFIAGNGLPPNVGTDVVVPLFDLDPPNDALVTLTTATTPPVVHDAPGAYHVAVPIVSPGLWQWRGYGQDGSGNPLASTLPQAFKAAAL